MDPEEYFRKGLVALKTGRTVEAVAHFESAVTAESRQLSIRRPRMRYLSYYGLSMAIAHRPSDFAIRMCEKAARSAPFDPLLLHNLGEVYLLAGRITDALSVFEQGLRLDPRNRNLRARLSKVDRRSKPPIKRLTRDHPINKWLGRLRSTLFPPGP